MTKNNKDLPISMVDPHQIDWRPQKKTEFGIFWMGFNPTTNAYHACCSDPRFVFVPGSAGEVMKQINTTVELYQKHLKDTSNVAQDNTPTDGK